MRERSFFGGRAATRLARVAPNPTTPHPLPAHERVVFLKALVTSPRIVVGEYTYYDDPDGATEFEHRNVLYGYGPNDWSSADTAPSPRAPAS